MANRKLIVEVVGDSRSLERAFARSSKASKQFGTDMTATATIANRGMSSLSKLFVGGIAGGAALAGLKSSVGAASDLAEQGAKVEQVFGRDSATGIEAWAKTTANAFGVSERAALTATGTFGNLFNTVGLAPQKSAAMSKSLVKLAADLASFNNADPSEVLDALRSGLIGEAEPLRRFGVLLSEARVQQEALRETGKAHAKDLTDQEKALARYNLILKDTAPAQGDFARTASGAANSSRRLRANLANLQANLGAGLVPALARATGGLADLTAAMQTASITADQLVNNRALRDKFADAFGVDELFKALNQITSEGLANRLDESTRRIFEPATKTADKSGKAFVDAMKKAINFAQHAVDEALTKGTAARSRADAQAAAEKAAQRRSDAFARLIGTLGLGVDRAGLTRRLGDDLDALQDLKAGLQKQIRAGIDVSSAQSQLVSVLGQIADKQAQISAQQKDALQARQFRALGLTATGDEPVPGIKNLAKRINQALRNEDLGKVDISSKLVSRLKAARKLIKTEGGKLTEDTRRVINEFLKAATGQDAKTKTDGPLTKTSALNINRILGGVPLNRDLEKELRSRLSGLNSAGLSLAGKTGATGGFATAATGQPLVVQMQVDGKTVAQASVDHVTVLQQRTRRRNPPQKRGPNARSGV